MEDSVKELLSSMLFSDFSASSQKARKRKIIFWYDPSKAFIDNIDELQFENTEILKYDNNSLWIRYHIEKEELNKNIIIYLPIERSTGSNNNLLDLETANPDLIFNPDKTNMKLRDLGLPEECRSIIKKYMRFFNNKTRETEFLNFDIEDKNTDNIDYIVTSILLGIKTINIDDIMKAMDGTFETNITYEQISSFIKMQLNDMAKWDIETYNVNGSDGMEYTASFPTQKSYVMYPDYSTVNEAKNKINEVLGNN